MRGAKRARHTLICSVGRSVSRGKTSSPHSFDKHLVWRARFVALSEGRRVPVAARLTRLNLVARSLLRETARRRKAGSLDQAGYMYGPSRLHLARLPAGPLCNHPAPMRHSNGARFLLCGSRGFELLVALSF